MKHVDGWIELERGVPHELRAMPSALAVPGDADHVVRENAAETRVGQELLPLVRSPAVGGSRHGELQGRGVDAHQGRLAVQRVKPGGRTPGLERKEGSGV